ncbi:tigger transposable element-derived protein 1-like isoform 1-T3 [Glossina fuscipes fuscipes]
MDQGIIQAFKLYYIRQTFKIILDNVECNPDMNVMECRKNFDVAKCIAHIKESLEELKPHTLKSYWKNLWPALTAEKDKETVQVQTLTANIAEIANGIHGIHGIGRDRFEQIESSDIEKLLESQDEDLTEIDLEEMLNSEPIEEEASTSTGNVTFNLKCLRKGLRMANELDDFFMNIDWSMERSLIFKRQIANVTAAYQSELKELLKTAKQVNLQNSSNRCLIRCHSAFTAFLWNVSAANKE